MTPDAPMLVVIHFLGHTQPANSHFLLRAYMWFKVLFIFFVVQSTCLEIFFHALLVRASDCDAYVALQLEPQRYLVGDVTYIGQQ